MTAREVEGSSLSRLRERARVRARSLRRFSPEAERALWQALRNRQLAGWKFRRQHPIGPFFADFACVEAGLVIEVDGGQHFEADAIESDRRRTDALADAGFQVMRFTDREVLLEREAVLSAILNRLTASHPHPHPLPPAGEGAVHLSPRRWLRAAAADETTQKEPTP